MMEKGYQVMAGSLRGQACLPYSIPPRLNQSNLSQLLQISRLGPGLCHCEEGQAGQRQAPGVGSLVTPWGGLRATALAVAIAGVVANLGAWWRRRREIGSAGFIRNVCSRPCARSSAVPSNGKAP